MCPAKYNQEGCGCETMTSFSHTWTKYGEYCIPHFGKSCNIRRLGMFRLIHFPLFSLTGPAHYVLLNACLAQHEREGGREGRREKEKQRKTFSFPELPHRREHFYGPPSLSPSPSPWFLWPRPYFHPLTGRVLRYHKIMNHNLVQMARQCFWTTVSDNPLQIIWVKSLFISLHIKIVLS